MSQKEFKKILEENKKKSDAAMERIRASSRRFDKIVEDILTHI